MTRLMLRMYRLAKLIFPRIEVIQSQHPFARAAAEDGIGQDADRDDARTTARAVVVDDPQDERPGAGPFGEIMEVLECEVVAPRTVLERERAGEKGGE